MNKLSQVKTQKLLNDLPMYLKGIGRTLESMPGKKAIFVILDSDDADCAELKKDLVEMYEKSGVTVDVYFLQEFLPTDPLSKFQCMHILPYPPHIIQNNCCTINLPIQPLTHITVSHTQNQKPV